MIHSDFLHHCSKWLNWNTEHETKRFTDSHTDSKNDRGEDHWWLKGFIDFEINSVKDRGTILSDDWKDSLILTLTQWTTKEQISVITEKIRWFWHWLSERQRNKSLWWLKRFTDSDTDSVNDRGTILSDDWNDSLILKLTQWTTGKRISVRLKVYMIKILTHLNDRSKWPKRFTDSDPLNDIIELNLSPKDLLNQTMILWMREEWILVMTFKKTTDTYIT